MDQNISRVSITVFGDATENAERIAFQWNARLPHSAPIRAAAQDHANLHQKSAKTDQPLLFSTLFAIKEEAYANNGWVLLAMPSTPLVSTSWNMQFLQQAAETFDKHVPMLRPALRINFITLWALHQETASMGKYDSDHRLSPSIEPPYSPL